MKLVEGSLDAMVLRWQEDFISVRGYIYSIGII